VQSKVTRRELAGALLTATAAAQTPAPSPSGAPANNATELEAARAQNKRLAETLAKASVPMDTDPAFHFTA
jgi:hypothetical protein